MKMRLQGSLMVLMAAVMLLSATTGVFALDETAAEGGAPRGMENSQVFMNIPGYDEFVSLREAGQELRAGFQANQEDLKQMGKVIKETENLEAAELALSYKEDAKALKEAQKELGQVQKAAWQAMKAAIEAEDAAQMESVMQELISGRQALNANLQSAIALQEELIAALNGLGIS